MAKYSWLHTARGMRRDQDMLWLDCSPISGNCSPILFQRPKYSQDKNHQKCVIGRGPSRASCHELLPKGSPLAHKMSPPPPVLGPVAPFIIVFNSIRIQDINTMMMMVMRMMMTTIMSIVIRRQFFFPNIYTPLSSGIARLAMST